MDVISLSSEIISADTLNIFWNIVLTSVVIGFIIGILYHFTKWIWK